MRVLFITNYYPPCDQGWGYMQLCEEVADGMGARGHDIAVLTSTRRDGPEIARPYPVHRLLPIDPDWQSGRTAAQQFFIGRRRRERQAVLALQTMMTAFRPEILFVWHAIGLPRALLRVAEQVATTVYYLAGYLPELPDEYIAYWQAQPMWGTARLLKCPLAKLALAMLRHEGKPIQLSYTHVICVSEYVRRRLLSQSLISPESVVIHNGVNLGRFKSREASLSPACWSRSVACIYAGHIVPEKGVHTLVDAFVQLRKVYDSECMPTLTILGSGPSDYLGALQHRVQLSGMSQHIEFQGPVPREQMPSTLSRYQVLVLPSEYDEPLARSMQEGMATGLLIVGTTTGGSGELLIDGETGLVFQARNATDLAKKIQFVNCHRAEAVQIACNGQRRIVECFGIEQTIGKIERYLSGLVMG